MSPVNFARPPLVEVALTVQFDGEAMDDAALLNGFWPRIRNRYPRLVMQPPLAPLREDFGPSPPGLSIQLIGPGAGTRYWFLTEDQAELVQVQRDRFAFNWRKETAPGVEVGEYPRYPYVRERFAELFAEFEEAAGQARSGFRINWCEIAYINQIPAASERGHRPLASILRLVQNVPLNGLPNPEDSALVQRHLLLRDDRPFGRFYINANSAFKLPALEPIYILNLTVRGMPSDGPEGDGVLAFMDVGRDLIVNAFRDATTEAMHAEWGLQ